LLQRFGVTAGDVKETMLPEPASQQHPACVLVVEDEILLRIVLAGGLREAGFVVIEAERAEEALSYFQAGGQVDLVISDIQMPGSPDGLELANVLRRNFPALPIILTSGNVKSQPVSDAILFVPKPYRVAQVVEIVFSTLGLRKPGNAT
jgi:CheY-like chemotaxis protein